MNVSIVSSVNFSFACTSSKLCPGINGEKNMDCSAELNITWTHHSIFPFRSKKRACVEPRVIRIHNGKAGILAKETHRPSEQHHQNAVKDAYSDIDIGSVTLKRWWWITNQVSGHAEKYLERPRTSNSRLTASSTQQDDAVHHATANERFGKHQCGPPYSNQRCQHRESQRDASKRRRPAVLPEFYWAFEYSNYLKKKISEYDAIHEDSDDVEKRKTVHNLRAGWVNCMVRSGIRR